MSMLLTVLDRIDNVVKGVGKYASLLILPLIGVTMIDVITRKFTFLQQAILNSPLHNLFSPTKLQELEWHLHAAIFVLSFGFCYLANAHVRVDLFKERLSKRRQAVIEFLGLVFLAMPYLFVMNYFGWGFFVSAFLSGEGSSALTGIPYRWVIKLIFLTGLILLNVAVISTALRILVYLFAKGDVQRQAFASLHIFPHVEAEEIDERLPAEIKSSNFDGDHK